MTYHYGENLRFAVIIKLFTTGPLTFLVAVAAVLILSYSNTDVKNYLKKIYE